jgi:putative addiction module component (TIGR02574 family)
MDIALPLDQMTVAEKLHVIEMVWDDLSRNSSDIPTPAWHEEVLAARQRQVDEGRAKFIPFEEFSQRIREETR